MDHSLQHQGKDLDHLLQDWMWLGELAGKIVRDAGLADDARQSAWLATRSDGPPAGIAGERERRARMYWALRHFTSNTKKSERRRARRERVAAREEALPSTEHLILRGEQRQRVWNALKDLPDPLRGTLLLHFQDGMSPGEIAARSGAKADTVRRRIQRGVEDLRVRLDADRDGGGVLALAAAIPRSDASAAGATTLAPAMVLGGTLAAGALMLAKGAIVIGTVVGLAFLGRELTEPEPAPVVPDAVMALDDEQVSVVPAGSPAPRESALARHAPVESRVEVATKAEPAVARPPVATWSGSIVVHDAEGGVISDSMAGTIRASISVPMKAGSLTSSGSISLELPFHSGRFEVSVAESPEGTWGCWDLSSGSSIQAGDWVASDLVLMLSGPKSPDLGPLVLMESGTSPRVTGSRRVEFGAEGIELHARVIAPVVVNVLDSRNGKVHLDQVEIAAGRSSTSRWEIANPRDRNTLATIQASPITLVIEPKYAGQQSVPCFLYSPGFARRLVDLDLSNGGERTVELEPGGDLNAVIDGEVPRDAYLRVYVDEERWAPFSNLRAQGDASLELTGLPLGPAKVRVEKGAFFGDPIVLAEEEVLIQAGARASVLLSPRPFEAPIAVDVSGELVLPRGWDPKGMALRFRRSSPTTGSEDESSYLRVDELEAIDTTMERYAFSAGQLVPGEYVASLIPMEHKTSVTVPPTGTAGLRIVIPPPVTVTVTVRDSVTGEISDLVDHINWLPVFEGRGGFTSYPQVTRDSATRRFYVQVPAGPVEFSISGEGVTRDSCIVDALPGLPVELEVRRVARASIEFAHEGRHVAWPRDFSWEGCWQHLDGNGEIVSRGSNRSGVHFSVSVPGVYSFAPPPVEGFRQPESIEIEMTIEQEQQVVVELIPD